MQLGAIKQSAVEMPLVGEGHAIALEAASGVFTTGFAQPLPSLFRRDVVALVGLSIVLHGLFAFQLSRTRSAPVVVREKPVVIEFHRPPPPPVIPPPAVEPEKPAPIAKKSEVRRAEPRTVAKLEPLNTPKIAAPTNELPELPVGDDPALAMASGKGTGEAVAAPPPPSAPKVVAPPPVAAHEGANYLKNPRPAYPEIAMRRGWEGEVLLRIRVSPDGRPIGISIQKSSGRDVLDQAATDTVRTWTFVPARLGGQPVAGWVTVPIVFHLQ